MARLLIAAIVIALATAGATSGVDSRSVSYVESSLGLDEPGFEGGDTELEMGDVDGDGHLDLVSVGDHGNPLINSNQRGIMVWFGNGNGVWNHFQTGHLGYGGVALGDVNGDGLMDVAYGIHHNYASVDLGDQLLEVALGDGTGTSWVAWDDGLAVHGQSWGMFSTDLGDVDGDGDLDVGSMGFGASDGLQVYLNQGDGTWKRGFGYLHGNSNHVFVFGDVNGDGHRDIATSKAEGTVWVGDGEGFFTLADGDLPPPPSGWVHDGVDLGDVDGDGRDDLAYCDSTDHPRVFLSRGEGVWGDVSAGLPPSATCEHTQLRDMDGDGLTDLTTFGDGEVRVFAGDGAGQDWTQLAQFTTGDSPGRSRAFRVGGDFDDNGLPDMVLVNTKQIDLFNDINILHAYREASAVTSLAARAVEPGPGRRLLAGSVSFVEWASSVPRDVVSTVSLHYSTTGPAGPWLPIAAARPNNGRHQWIVPPAYSADCHVRVTVTTDVDEVSAVSAIPFTIDRRPDPLTITFPTAQMVTWTDQAGRDRYNLYRSDWQHFLSAGDYTQDPGGVVQADRFCDLRGTARLDAFTPASGTLVYYLVTGYRMMEDGQVPGVEVPMAEGTLGQDSDAVMRVNAHPCPASP